MSPIFDIKEHIISASHIREYSRATSRSQVEELRLHVKQYTPRDNPNPRKGDVTIIGGHANGFPKELYEPLWEDLYRETKARGIRIRTIYIADCAWQGQSGLLNRSKLGNDPSWNDYARDITHMINTLRPSRPLVGIGHSFGGASLVNVALAHPRLFTTLVLLDPVIARFTANQSDMANSPATMSIYRRDVWPSRAEARQAFGKSPFYATWDKRVLDTWIQQGLRPTNEDNPDGEVTLVTSKHQEVFTFLRPSWPAFDAGATKIVNPSLAPDLEPAIDKTDPSKPVNLTYPFYRPEPTTTTGRLPHLRPSTLYLFGGKSELSPPVLQKEKMETTGTGVGGSGGILKGRVKKITSKDNGHLIPLESPQLCAESAAAWLQTELDLWREEEEEYEAWTRRSQEEKSTVSDDYKKHAGKPIRASKKNKSEAKL